MDMEQKVEMRAKALYYLWRWSPGQGEWGELPATGLRVAFRRIARADLEREGRLLKGVDDAIGVASRGIASGWSLESVKSRLQMHRDDVRLAYEAEFAPPQRTVEEVLGEMKRVQESGATDLAGAAEKQRRVNELLAEALLALKKGGA